MSSKRKIILSISTAILVCALILFVLNVVYAAMMMQRDDISTSHRGPLAYHIEQYKEENGHYPKSYEEFYSKSDPKVQSILKIVTHDKFNDNYRYIPGSNSFTISIVSSNVWPIKWPMITKVYGPGDAYKDFNVTTTTLASTNDNK